MHRAFVHCEFADTCARTTEYVVVGSGAGGSVAAAYLHARGVPYEWYEAGGDESEKLRMYSALDENSMPAQYWTPTQLQSSDSTPFHYEIPQTTGGQTSHYSGNSYWTASDTTASLKLTGGEHVALDFVKRHTLSKVHCDAFDARYHTHARSHSEPAPEAVYTSLPACMYGNCTRDGSCRLNRYYTAQFISPPDELDGWHRNSAFVEYGAARVQLHSKILRVFMEGSTAKGVHVLRDGDVSLTCASKAVILSAGVMGNAPLLLPLVTSYEFYGQPVLTHVAYAPCDASTISGGTFHKTSTSGFLSTLGICSVDGEPHVLWATPQAVNAGTRGVIEYGDSSISATINYDDEAILSTLKRDVREAVEHLFHIPNFTLQGSFRYPSYHWSGSETLVHRSRVKHHTNLYVGDALGITGPTSGWTSFNARVSGAVAAHRALADHGDLPPEGANTGMPLWVIVTIVACIVNLTAVALIVRHRVA